MSAPHLRDASAPEQRTTTNGTVPRYDADAEAAVLSAVLVEATSTQPGKQPRAFSVCLPLLGEGGAALYSLANRRIWQAMCALARAGDPLDAVNVGAWLKGAERLAEVGGVPYLANLIDSVPSVDNVESYARIVVDLYAVRDLGARCQRVAAESYRPTTDPVGWVAESLAYLGEAERGRSRRSSAEAGDIAAEIYDKLEAPDEGPGAWLSTGLAGLDEAIGGLLPGDVLVLGARPSIGKSSLARRIALACAQAKRRPAIFGREMPRRVVTQTLLTSLARINGRRWRVPGDVKKVEMTRAVQWLREHPVLVYDDLHTPADVAAECKGLRASASGLDLVIVDYLQTFRPNRGAPGGNAEQALSDMMGELAGIALPSGADVPIIVISSIKRPSDEASDPGPPTERDLKGSSSIESWATAIVLLHRRTHYRPELPDKSGVCEVYVPKSRLGPTGYSELWFDAPTATFFDTEGDKYR